MTIIEAVGGITQTEFLFRVKFFIVKAAIAIQNEDPATPLHPERRALAAKILADPDFWAPRMALGVVTNPTILAHASVQDATDSEIEFQVNSQFSAYT